MSSVVFIVIIIGFVISSIFNGCSSKKDTSENQTPNAGLACQSSPVAKGTRQFGMDILDQE